MPAFNATASACANIAFIKYWGNRDHNLRLPANGSISMNLGGLVSRTTVSFSPDYAADSLTLNGKEIRGAGVERAGVILDLVRARSGIPWHARVDSENNFPTGAGIASSASGFAALSLAASRAAGLELDEASLSRLARRASGSACRSIPGGFVEWQAGVDESSSFAFSLAPETHWNLADCVAVISLEHKATSSAAGHGFADSSPLQAGRISGANQRLAICRAAILQRDFEALAEISEFDSNLMHAVIMTQKPPIFYWQPTTLAVMQAVKDWRAHGLPVFYTIDAGPNVHVLCPVEESQQIRRLLEQIPGVQQVLSAVAGGPARILHDNEP